MQEPIPFIPLDSIQVATPCRASWEKMQGNEQVRFCQTCAKNVYNLSGMSRAEAEALIQQKEGNLCARFYRRADGTIITDDCPVGLRIVKRPFKWMVAGIAALFTMGFAAVHHAEAQNKNNSSGFAARQIAFLTSLRYVQPIKTVVDRFSPPEPVAGGISLAPPPTGNRTPLSGNSATPEICEKPGS